METKEHTELGNQLKFSEWSVLQNNPFIHKDKDGLTHIHIQGIDEHGLPEDLDLKISPGAIIGMSGDYFGGKEVDLDLPSQFKFRTQKLGSNTAYVCEQLGDYLVNLPITRTEEEKMLRSYKRLANKTVCKKDIDTIYAIDSARYIPFSTTLNSYVQQVMFALRVKNYGEILNKNVSHFTPWSVRAYILGHNIALKYAKISHEFTKMVLNEQYQSTHDESQLICSVLKQKHGPLSKAKLEELAHRYQALALGIELFSFHYYTDHFAAGHGALIGDLRDLLPQRFGYIGGILVNNLHDELNEVTVYTKKPYDPTPDRTDPPVKAGGDGDFDSDMNSYNKQSCIDGMHYSLNDLHSVMNGHEVPNQCEYGGLEQLPDIDPNYRQPQPLFLLSTDNRIFYRTNLSKIGTFSPSEFKRVYDAPEEFGYTELTSYFTAILLVIKLRIFSYFYKGSMQSLNEEDLHRLEEEEKRLNPERKPIQHGRSNEPVGEWRGEPSNTINNSTWTKNTLWKNNNKNAEVLQEDDDITSTSSMTCPG